MQLSCAFFACTRWCDPLRHSLPVPVMLTTTVNFANRGCAGLLSSCLFCLGLQMPKLFLCSYRCSQQNSDLAALGLQLQVQTLLLCLNRCSKQLNDPGHHTGSNQPTFLPHLPPEVMEHLVAALFQATFLSSDQLQQQPMLRAVRLMSQ